MIEEAWREFFDEAFLSRLERLRLVAKSALARSRAGARRSRGLGDGLEFADHRPYSPGDDVRFIDWPYYARMEKLLLRLFHEHSEAGVGILLDCSASMAPGGRLEKFHAARRAAAALAYVAMSGGERVRLAPFAEDLGRPLRTGRNRAQFFHILEWMADLQPADPRGAQSGTRLRHCTERFLQGGSPPSTVLILSDFLGCREDLGPSLARLRLAGAAACAVHVFSPADAEPDLDGPLLLENSEPPAGRPPARLSLLVSPEVLQSYRRRWRDLCALFRRTCLSEGALYVPAPTDAPMDSGLLLALRQAGVVQG